MTQLHIFDETLTKKISQLEKRMRWLQKDLWMYKQIAKVMLTHPMPKQLKLQQLDLFDAT